MLKNFFNMPRILLVGTGITSAITGTLIKQQYPYAELILWDKAKGAGGRMCTYWNSKDRNCTADLGAQYISATPDYARIHRSFYSQVIDKGILSPLIAKVEGMRAPAQEGTEHYVAPKGVSSVVKHFLGQLNAEIKFQHHVTSIDKEGDRWTVRTNNGVKDSFDAVVLTMPVPQILTLSGKIKNLIEKNKVLHKNLREVEYSSRFALGLFFDKDANIELANLNSAQYVQSDPIMRFVSIDNEKRGDEDASPSAVFHTSIPFGKAYLEKKPSEVESSLLAKVKEMYPKWPEPVYVKCHKWRYSQVTSAYPGLPGAVEIDNGLVAGGDGFTQSNFDSCIESAKAAADIVSTFIENTTL